MVDDHVGIDLDASLFAGPDHLDEFGFSATAAVEFIAHGLVSLVPRVIGESHMFLRRGDLDCGESLGSQVVGAFLGDVGPLPFEEVNEGAPVGEAWEDGEEEE